MPFGWLRILRQTQSKANINSGKNRHSILTNKKEIITLIVIFSKLVCRGLGMYVPCTLTTPWNSCYISTVSYQWSLLVLYMLNYLNIINYLQSYMWQWKHNYMTVRLRCYLPVAIIKLLITRHCVFHRRRAILQSLLFHCISYRPLYLTFLPYVTGTNYPDQ